MLHPSLLAALEAEFVGAFEIARASGEASLGELLEDLSECRCTSEQFEKHARRISPIEAEALLAATFRGSMAYSSEKYMSSSRASELAEQFVSSFGVHGQFYSTTCVPDHVEDGIAGWYFVVSGHTFEVALYANGEGGSAFLLVVEED